MAYSNSRRNFMATTVQSVGLAALGGMLWSGYTDSVKASPLVLRPPGALPEKDFLTACIKCGLCAEACVNRDTNIDTVTGEQREGTLKMAKGGDSVLIGTPYFVPVEVPCYMCEEIPCVPVCPSGALDMTSLLNEKKELDINKSSMGLAVVHKESCIAFGGIQCDVCYRACPLMGKAIVLEKTVNEFTGKHANLKPVVNGDYCTGCGICENVCVVEKAAIFVLPVDKVTGKTGDHYVESWNENEDKGVQPVEKSQRSTDDDVNSAIDYLNSDNEMFDE